MVIREMDVAKAAQERAAQDRRKEVRSAWDAAVREHRADAAARKLGQLQNDRMKRSQWEKFERGALADSAALLQGTRERFAAESVRKISALRARGEDEKADALLAHAQDFLAQLAKLSRWAAHNSVSGEELRAQLERWTAFAQAAEG